MIFDTHGSLGDVEDLVHPIKPKVVVISRRDSLLGCAVEYLTADEREWVILGISENQVLEDLVRKVEKANPQIVIISQGEFGNDAQLSIRLMLDCPELRKVILVSLSENLMEVYWKQKIQVSRVEDLFSEVENQFSKL